MLFSQITQMCVKSLSMVHKMIPCYLKEVRVYLSLELVLFCREQHLRHRLIIHVVENF